MGRQVRRQAGNLFIEHRGKAVARSCDRQCVEE